MVGRVTGARHAVSMSAPFQEEFPGVRRHRKAVEEPEGPPAALGIVEQPVSNRCAHILDPRNRHRTASR